MPETRTVRLTVELTVAAGTSSEDAEGFAEGALGELMLDAHGCELLAVMPHH